HLRQGSFGRLEYQRFQTFNAEHVVHTVEHFYQAIRVQHQAVTRREFDVLGRSQPRSLGKATEDAVLRFMQAYTTVGYGHRCWMTSADKSRPATTHTETNCGHGEVKAVCRKANVRRVMKVPQQFTRCRLAFELMQRFGVN